MEYESRISDWSSDVCSSDRAEQGSASVIGTMGMPGPAATAPSGKPPSFTAVILLILLPLLLIMTGTVADILAKDAMINGDAFWVKASLFLGHPFAALDRTSVV